MWLRALATDADAIVATRKPANEAPAQLTITGNPSLLCLPQTPSENAAEQHAYTELAVRGVPTWRPGSPKKGVWYP